jgi:hypothetical protein
MRNGFDREGYKGQRNDGGKNGVERDMIGKGKKGWTKGRGRKRYGKERVKRSEERTDEEGM